MERNVDGKKYIRVNFAAIKINVTKDAIRKLLKAGEVTGFKVSGGTYVSENDVNEIQKKIQGLNDNYYTIKEISKILMVSENVALRYCTGKTKKFDSIVKSCGKLYILKSEVNKYTQEIIKNNTEYYDCDAVSKILGISIQKVKKLILEKGFSNVIVRKRSKYVSKVAVDEFAKKYIIENSDDYINVPETCKMYGLSLTHVNKLAHKFPNTRVLFCTKAPIRLYKKDIEEYLQSKKFKDQHITITDNKIAYEYFIGQTREIAKKSNCTETIELFNKFVWNLLKISKAKNLKVRIQKLTATYRYLFGVITKEINQFTDQDIKLLFESDQIIHSHAINIVNFLKYCKMELREKCIFEKVPKRKNVYQSREDKETIPEAVFMQYYSYSTDLKCNLIKAIKDSKYTQLWLYIMFHLFEAWRAGDIVSIPNIDLTKINVSNLEYFMENGDGLSTTQAEMVIGQYYLHEFVVNKTGAINGFNVPGSLVIPLGTALVVAELHRRANHKEFLMYHFQARFPGRTDWLKFFNGNESLAVFSNLKACRTLMTLYYEHLSEQSDCQELAHELSRKKRAHKLGKNKFGFTDTTSIYIQERNNEVKAKNLSKHVFERGNYGFLYNTLLKLATEDTEFKQLSLADKTAMIAEFQNRQSPVQIEALGKFLLTQQIKRNTLIMEISAMPKQHLLEKIQKIYQGILPSKLPEAQCFKYGNCPYHNPNKQKCYRCKYLLPNKYFLISLQQELYQIIDKIQNLNKGQVAENVKLRTLLYDYMVLLGEALDNEDGLGQKTVDAFINRDELMEKLSSLK